MRPVLASLLFLGLATAAAAQPAPDRRGHAVQCLLAMSAASGSTANATGRDAAKIGMLFFAAELFGMDPNIDLTAAVRTQLGLLTRNRVQALIPLCGNEMHARERQIAAIGPGLRGR